MQLYLVSEGLDGYITQKGSNEPVYVATIDPIDNTAKFIEPSGEFEVVGKDGKRTYMELEKVRDIYRDVLNDFRRDFKGIVLENGELNEFSENHSA